MSARAVAESEKSIAQAPDSSKTHVASRNFSRGRPHCLRQVGRTPPKRRHLPSLPPRKQPSAGPGGPPSSPRAPRLGTATGSGSRGPCPARSKPPCAVNLFQWQADSFGDPQIGRVAGGQHGELLRLERYKNVEAEDQMRPGLDVDQLSSHDTEIRTRIRIMKVEWNCPAIAGSRSSFRSP